MKQFEKKQYSVKQIFNRSLICNAAYFVSCAIFIALIFQNNQNHSQDPTPLFFFICAVAALISSGFEMFLRDEQNNKFLPIAKYWIFFGKIFLFVIFEAVMILFGNFLAVILTVTILPTMFLLVEYFIFRKYLKFADRKTLTINYKIEIKETRKKYIGFTLTYFALSVACVIWLVLEIILGNKIAKSINIQRIVLNVILLFIFLCAAIVNLIHAIKFDRQDSHESI